jgi:Fe-S-cluster containining protein
MATFCLSIHAGYGCRHSGACCSAPWRIPVEPESLPLLREHREIAEILDRSHDESDLGRREDGTCVFFEANRGRLCTIHRVGGAGLLPSACRHFPRVALNDRRGTFVTLSAFCPTAAAMLEAHVPLRIISAPPSLAGETLEGLDATGVLPPLLRSGLLADLDGYSAWEHAAIAVLDRDDLDVDRAMDVIATATSRVQQWSPGAATLASHVWATFRQIAPPAGVADGRGARAARMFAGAHLFASWAAYQDGGVGAVVIAARDAVARLRREMAAGAPFIDAARAVDLVLRHTQQEPAHVDP